MAAITIGQPGSEFGPCADERCGHTDCFSMRQDARSICGLCKQPIGYDRRFVTEYAAMDLVHESCAFDDAERKAMRESRV